MKKHPAPCVLLAAVACGVLGCEAGPTRATPDAGKLVWGDDYLDRPDAPPDTGAPLKEPTAVTPQGWHRWPFPPDDCDIFVPDDPATAWPLIWEPCPFMPDGCTRAGAYWADKTGWGFGGLLSAAVIHGHIYLVVSRKAHPDHWWEAVLLRDNVVIGTWRIQAPQSQCVIGGPYLGTDGRASICAYRAQAENAPHIFWGSNETLMSSPEHTEIFGPPDAYTLANGFHLRTDTLLTFGEFYGRFTVRNLVTGATFRPEPDQPYHALSDPVPIGSSVAYYTWTGYNASIWVWSEAGGSRPLLKDNDFSYDNFVADGIDAAWTRSTGQTDINTFDHIELWTSPVATETADLKPRKLWTIPLGGIVPLSIGEGWVGVFGGTRIWLVRIRDGLVREIPPVDGLCWNAWGQYDGLVIAGGAVWVKTCLDPGAGNDIRFITRFEIDKLPQVEKPNLVTLP